MWALRRTLLVVGCVLACAALLPVGSAQAAHSPCAIALRKANVTGPTHATSWRVGLEARTAVLDRVPGRSLRASAWVAPTQAPWLLVVGRARAAYSRCWLQVRLPWRPNGATGWVNANAVLLEKNPWRIAISTSRRTLTVFRAGTSVRTMSVVVGKPSTPTPAGLFGIVWVIPWHPNDFLGSWVIELSAHSDVLRQFDGGDGTVGIHGRGGASLLDPLGSARSHGCIRLANESIDWLVHTIGANQLPGTAVQIG